MADSADNIQTYRQMLKLDRRSRVFALLAEQLCAAGQWEEAVEVCRKGLVFHPDHLRSRVLLGWALMETGDVSQSERILLTAVEDIRKNATIFELLSKLAASSGNTQSAGDYARIYDAFQTAGPAKGGIAPPLTPDTAPELKSEPDEILIHLAQRIEGRIVRRGPPAAILSEDDKNMLKEKIVAVLGA